jgi:hypothetical protein
MTATKRGLAALLFSGTLVLVGCEPKGPAEQAGEKIDNAADAAADALDPRGPMEKAGDKLDEAGQNVGEAVDNATNP